jgi:hypothetical protein
LHCIPTAATPTNQRKQDPDFTKPNKTIKTIKPNSASMADSNPSSSCSAWFLRAVCLDFLNPETPFLLFLRKIVILVGIFNAAFVGMYLPVFISLNAANFTLASYLGLLSYIIRIVVGVVPYVVAQRTGGVPDWSIALMLFGSTIGGIVSCFVSPGFPFSVYVAAFAIFAAICDMPRRPLFFVLLAVQYAISAWNQTAAATNGPLLIAPGTPPPSVAGLLIQYTAAAIFLSIPAAACGVLIRKALTLLAAADATNELSCNVAALLKQYDTDGVSRALDAYAELPDADPALVHNFRELVDNLDRYRPHLPNWMIDGADDASESSVRSAASHSTRMSKRQSTTASHVSHSLSARGHQHDDGGSSGATAVPDVRCAAYNGTVAFAVVAFKVAPEQSADARGAALSAFVDTVHQIASATHCALHTFVGDTVQLSWNAAMRVAQPEVKAARFMCRLKAAVAETCSTVSVSGAVMSGKAGSQFAGTGRVSALAVSLPWRQALMACASFAQQRGLFVISGAGTETAAHVCGFKPVELLRVAVGDEQRNVVVHEILDERDDDDDDEWMYVMEKHTADGGKAYHDAFACCVTGHYADAVALLHGQDESAAPADMAAAHLLARAESAMLSGPESFATAACGCCA